MRRDPVNHPLPFRPNFIEDFQREYDQWMFRHTMTFAEYHARQTAWVHLNATTQRAFGLVVEAVWQEQEAESARLRDEMRNARRFSSVVKPLPIRVIDWDTRTSLQARIYCPGRGDMWSTTYSVTYYGAPYEETRAAFLTRIERLYAEAQADPFGFFEEVW